MEKARPILYGVADYAQIRKKNAWFVDRTAKIRDLEDIAHAALVEMKYVKAGDPAPTAEQLAKIKSEAIDQLDKYSSDPALVAKWHIGGRGATALPGSDRSVASPKETTHGEAALPSLHDGADCSCVALHCLVFVFHGGDCVLAEEV